MFPNLEIRISHSNPLTICNDRWHKSSPKVKLKHSQKRPLVVGSSICYKPFLFHYIKYRSWAKPKTQSTIQLDFSKLLYVLCHCRTFLSACCIFKCWFFSDYCGLIYLMPLKRRDCLHDCQLSSTYDWACGYMGGKLIHKNAQELVTRHLFLFMSMF